MSTPYVFIQFASGDVHKIQVWNGFDMGNLLVSVCEIQEQFYGEEYVDCERVLLYNKCYERIDFLDEDFLTPGDFFHVVIMDASQLDHIYHGYDEFCAEW